VQVTRWLIDRRDDWFGWTPQMRRQSYLLLPFVIIFPLVDLAAGVLLALKVPFMRGKPPCEQKDWR
jgi:hypothetical protein